MQSSQFDICLCVYIKYRRYSKIIFAIGGGIYLQYVALLHFMIKLLCYIKRFKFNYLYDIAILKQEV